MRRRDRVALRGCGRRPHGTRRGLHPVMRASSRVFRHSGLLIVSVTVVASGWFAARALAHVGEGAVFDDRGRTAAPAPPRPVERPSLLPAPDPAALVTRNMFCSTCAPPATGGAPPPGQVPHAVPRLIATQTGRDPWATIDDPATGVAGLFRVGAQLPSGGVIESIERGVMVVRFPDDLTERVTLAGGDAAAKPAPVAAAPASPWADRIRASGDNRWEVDRTLIRELVQAGTGTAAVKGVRLSPISKDGKLAGIRLSQARDGSLARALGLQTGDVIETVDGKVIDSAAGLMELYARLDDTRRVDLGIKRKGATQTLVYDLP